MNPTEPTTQTREANSSALRIDQSDSSSSGGLDQVKHQVKNSASAFAEKTDSFTRENPWKALGLAVLGGVAIRGVAKRLPDGFFSLGSAVSLARLLYSVRSGSGTENSSSDTSLS